MTAPGGQDVEQLTADDRAAVAAAAAAHGVRPVPGSDVAAVGEFIDADRQHREALQRAMRAADAVAGLYAPVRAEDRQAEAAQHLLVDLEAAEASAQEWTEALQQQRDAVLLAAQDRQQASGRGPKAWAAQQRLATTGSTRSIHAERVAEAQAHTQEVAERLGTMDPARWAELRAEAVGTLEAHPERRAALVADAALRGPRVLSAHEAAREAERAAFDRREAAEAELARRHLDSGRISEVAAQVGGAAVVAPGSGATEAALAGWQQEQPQVGRDGIDVDLWEQQQPEQQAHQRER